MTLVGPLKQVCWNAAMWLGETRVYHHECSLIASNGTNMDC